jgi:hypothetical protein
MNLRHLAPAAIAVGAFAVTSAPASATCYVGNIDICDKPTDPYTDPIVHEVERQVDNVIYQPVFDPVWSAYGSAYGTVYNAYLDALCVVNPSYSWC